MTIQQIADELKRNHKELTRRFTDQMILGDLLQPCDANKDFVVGQNYYTWYYCIGAMLRPKRILEMGTRYGYSLKALTDGAHYPKHEFDLFVIDDERDGEKTLHIFEKYFYSKGYKDIPIIKQDTQSLTSIRLLNNPMDLVHVDAWHTEPGVYHECGLAYKTVKNGGIIIVDDTNPGAVADGAERFCREQGLDFAFLPTLRGMHIIQVPT